MVKEVKCPYCGGTAEEVSADAEKTRCRYCKRWFALPSKLDLEKQALYEQGKRGLEMMRYDEAEVAFRRLTELDPDFGEAYWQQLLSHYGIEYVEEISSGEFYPTIARLTDGSILDNNLYRQALANTSDDDVRAAYMVEAQRINDILIKYRQLAKTHVYDVFVSVKQGDSQGKPTRDSDEALRLTEFLVKNHLRVFNSRISLKDMVGKEYEPYIMAGLLSAKAMIVVASSRDNLESQWVRNEWIRFRSLRDYGRDKRILIPYLLDISPKELPAEMGALQCVKNDGKNAYDDILRAIYSTIPINELPDVAQFSIPKFLPLSSEKAEQYLLRVQEDLSKYRHLEKRPMQDAAIARTAVDNMDVICGNLRSLRRAMDVTKLEEYARRMRDAFQAEFERLRLGEHKAQLEVLEKQVSNGAKDYAGAILLRDTLQGINTEARSFQFEQGAQSVYTNATSLLREIQGTIEELNPERIKSDSMRCALAVGKGFIAALRRDGTVLVEGKDKAMVQEAEQWTDITAIAAGDNHLVGLKRDGRAIAAGNNRKGQCNLQEFRSVKYIFAVENKTFGLEENGFVFASGEIPKKQLETISLWRNIRFLSVSREHVVACDGEGHAYASGNPKSKAVAVNGLIDIDRIFAVGDATLAIRNDNHVDVLSDSPKKAAVQQKTLNDANTAFHAFVAQTGDSF